jgi:glycosyltransferase involved in cell wall biosynthesis
LKQAGIDVDVSPLFSNRYLDLSYGGRRAWGEVIRGYGRRWCRLLSAGRYDLLILEKELFPFMPALGERMLHRLGVRYLADYDDAVFHRYDGHTCGLVRRLLGRKIDVVMRCASAVIAGNPYLEHRARHAGARSVELIPTVVDHRRYVPRGYREGGREVTIGWMGTPKTSRYLTPLAPVIRRLTQRYGVRVVAVGAGAQDVERTPIEVRSWSESTEVADLQSFDVGIMPLSDSPWERGKCGYKIIQYMACGVPVVASPVGVNADLVAEGVNGYLATTNEEWARALEKLIRMSPCDRQRMGRLGREKVEAGYSVEAQAPRIGGLIRKWAGVGS